MDFVEGDFFVGVLYFEIDTVLFFEGVIDLIDDALLYFMFDSVETNNFT